MNSLQCKRSTFSNQNGQCLIIDIADINSEYLNNIIKVVQDVLTLACSVRGGIRIPAFSLSVLSTGNTEVYEFDRIRGNFNQIRVALASLPAYCHVNEDIDVQVYKDGLYHAIHSVLQKFTMMQTKHDWINSIAQIEITIVTIKNSITVKNYVEEIIQNLELSKINIITIIELTNSEENIMEHKFGLTQLMILNGSNDLHLQKYFKNWLRDRSNDIYLILYMVEVHGSQLAIKCDIFECIINPFSLPYGHRAQLLTDCLSVQLATSSIAKTDTSTVPIYELNIIARVAANATCESNVFGLPLCLKPTQSWKLSVEEDQLNQEYFLEICSQLAAAQECLLARIQSQFLTDQYKPTFLLMPGDNCLLMKSFATSEIILPLKQSNENISVSCENGVRISRNLENLEYIDNFDPNMYESGLFETLRANLKKSKPDAVDSENGNASGYKRNKKSK